MLFLKVAISGNSLLQAQNHLVEQHVHYEEFALCSQWLTASEFDGWFNAMQELGLPVPPRTHIWVDVNYGINQ